MVGGRAMRLPRDVAAIRRIVDRFVASNFADPRIGEIFMNQDKVRLKRTLFEQFCYILNAGCSYTGRDMKSAHKDMGVQQADMNRFGFEGILTEAAWARPQGLVIAPHNWGSLVGYYMQLHVGRAIENFYRAEHDPLSTPILVAEGYTRMNGETTVPSTPGFGLSIDENAFAAEAKVRFDLS